MLYGGLGKKDCITLVDLNRNSFTKLKVEENKDGKFIGEIT